MRHEPLHASDPQRFTGEEDRAFLLSDWKSCRETWEGLQEPCDSPDCSGLECDCQSSEVVVLEHGYAEVHRDGDVVSSHSVLFNVSGERPDPIPHWT